MKKRIRYFIVKNSTGPWSEEGRKLFANEIGKWGRVSVDYGSEREQEYEKYCKSIGEDCFKLSALIVKGKDIASVPFFHLCVDADRGYHLKRFAQLFAPGSACNYSGKMICSAGTRQIQKIEIDPKKRKNYDFMHVPYAYWERLLIISRSLKELLEVNKITGYRILPCLIAGKKYSKEEQSLEFTNDRLEQEATHFQLMVTGKAINPETTIATATDGYKCMKCGTLYFRSLYYPQVYGFSFFNPADLSEEDLQITTECKFEGESRIFRREAQGILISGKLLHLLLKHKMKGIGSRMDDPVIKYPVAEVLGATCDEMLLDEARRLYC